MKKAIIRDRRGTQRSRRRSTAAQLAEKNLPASRRPGYRRRRADNAVSQLVQLELPFDDPTLDR